MQETSICVVVFIEEILPQKSKCYQIVAYGKTFTLEIDIQHAKLQFY